jgi:hypothetical protein
MVESSARNALSGSAARQPKHTEHWDQDTCMSSSREGFIVY